MAGLKDFFKINKNASASIGTWSLRPPTLLGDFCNPNRLTWYAPLLCVTNTTPCIMYLNTGLTIYNRVHSNANPNSIHLPTTEVIQKPIISF